MHASLNSHEVSQGWLFLLTLRRTAFIWWSDCRHCTPCFCTTDQNDVFRPRRPRTSMDVIVSFEGGIGAHLFCPQLQFERKPTAGETARLRPCDAATVPGGDVAGGRRVGHDSLRTYKRATSTGNHSPGRTTQSPFAHQQPAKPAI